MSDEMTSQHPTPVAPSPQAPFPVELIERAILLLCRGVPPARWAALTAPDAEGRIGLPVEPERIGQLADLARDRVRAAAIIDRDEELGRTLLRLGDLYGQAVQEHDIGLALRAESIRARLLHLGPLMGDGVMAESGAAGPPPAEDDSQPIGAPRPADPGEVYDAIDELLEPLLPADPPGETAGYPARISAAAAALKQATRRLAAAERKLNTATRKINRLEASKAPAKEGRRGKTPRQKS